MFIIEDLLEEMKKPDEYDGPNIEIILKDTKTENLANLIDDMLRKYIPTAKNVAMFQKNE